jgi:phage virion morphogenesis protein
MPAPLTITINASLAFKGLESRLVNVAPLFKAWANHLEGRTVQAFKSEAAPDGSAWAALKPATVKRKAERKSPPSRNKILRDTGRLYDTVAATILPDGVKIGTNQQVGSYSLGAIHQFGAPQRRIPARPFLPMDANEQVLPGDEAELRSLAADWLTAKY